MACDGDIAKEEVAMVKDMTTKTSLFNGLNIEDYLNNYINLINAEGASFLKKYLRELANMELTTEEQLTVIELAIKMIEADNQIEYSEIKFFKKIRMKLSISDELILEKYPNKENFLLPDLYVADELKWDNVTFANIIFEKK